MPFRERGAAVCGPGRAGQLARVTTDSEDYARAARLLEVASAVLGSGRAAQLHEALADRAGLFARVSQAAVAPGEAPAAAAAGTPATRPLGQPGGASLAEWERCRARAEQLDGYLRAWALRAPPTSAGPAGTPGSLDGYVIGVKDVIDVAGMATRAGSALTTPRPAPADAPAVARLRAAGAAIAGKTECTQWALNDPAPTRNPWHADRTPGGSSAGSAVAVAAGMCTATLDTQTAGDVLRPAAYNGVTGFKPTIGWVTAAGSKPVAPGIDTLGVIARTAGEAAAVAAAVADQPQRFTARDMPGAPRIGVLGDGFTRNAGEAVRGNVSQALRRLAEAGADLRDRPCPVDLSLVHAAHRVITFAECAAVHLPGPGRLDGYGPRARELIELGALTPAHVYLHAQRVREHAAGRLAEMFTDVDAVVLPVTPGPAPGRETTGDSGYQIPWTLCGFPALSLPTGLSPDGLPLAIQLVAGLDREPSLLGAARWIERVLGLQLTASLEGAVTGQGPGLAARSRRR